MVREMKVRKLHQITYVGCKVSGQLNEQNKETDIIKIEFPTKEISEMIGELVSSETSIEVQTSFENPKVMLVRIDDLTKEYDVAQFLKVIEETLTVIDKDNIIENGEIVQDNIQIKEILMNQIKALGFELENENTLPKELESQILTLSITDHVFDKGKTLFNSTFEKLANRIITKYRKEYLSQNPQEVIISMASKYGVTLESVELLADIKELETLANKIKAVAHVESPYVKLDDIRSKLYNQEIDEHEFTKRFKEVVVGISAKVNEGLVHKIIYTVVESLDSILTQLPKDQISTQLIVDFLENSVAKTSAIQNLISKEVVNGDIEIIDTAVSYTKKLIRAKQSNPTAHEDINYFDSDIL